MGLILTLLAFAIGWGFGRRSLSAGVIAVLSIGYGYGILRANFYDGFAHFMFDSAVLGLYLARFMMPDALARPEAHSLTRWAWALMGWPVMVLMLFAVYPQSFLVQLVGLRAAVWFVPFLILGAITRDNDLTTIARALAVLNLVALAFAFSEYILGIEPFYPQNASTSLIYLSSDIAGYKYHRIPATFVTSAGYGGVMVGTIPWLTGRFQIPGLSWLERVLLGAGLFAAAVGTFMCGSRTPVVLLIVMGVVLAYQLRVRPRYLILAGILTAIVGYVVMGSERLQRFSTLQDSDAVAERLEGSAQVGFVDLLIDYPLGNGLGGGAGTSVPAFLEHLPYRQIGGENEYVRIGIEQGLVGILIWVGFLVWFLCRKHLFASRAWGPGGKLMVIYSLLVWGTAFLGTGVLMSVPGTCLMLFTMGVVARDRVLKRPYPGRSSRRRPPTRRVENAALPAPETT